MQFGWLSIAVYISTLHCSIKLLYYFLTINNFLSLETCDAMVYHLLKDKYSYRHIHFYFSLEKKLCSFLMQYLKFLLHNDNQIISRNGIFGVFRDTRFSEQNVQTHSNIFL